ncbi:serine/arginine-rich SC35-like splicing factor SCL30 isoform X1 [Aristolochia californica]|uniref:serine/arginine-rich SC35-like splicing factor SCL30 isoform X1 n=2 Tax=Aristolochia californica TaxID=171875 RepID=UPI0035DB7AE9
MRRYSPPYYSPPRRGCGGRARSPPRRGYGGYGGRKEQNHGSLLVRNVPLNCRPEDLRVPFERFGPVRDVYLPKDYYSGEPRGFAFVQFVDAYDASEAQYHMNGQLFGGREITVVVAAETRKRPEEMRTRSSTRGPGNGARRSSYYGHSRSRSVSRSRSPRYPSRSRARYRSRSYSPAPRRPEYSPSPERRHARSPRDRSTVRDEDHRVRNRSYSPDYEGGNRDEAGNGYIERGSYDRKEEGRAHWKSSPGRASAGSPPGSRSRSADLSPRRRGSR